MTSSLARKALGNSAAWLAATVGAFVVTALIFRRIGEAEFGLWATVLALRGVLVLLDGGLVLGVSRDAALLASERRTAWARVRAAWRLYAGLAALALALGALGAGLPGALLGVSVEGADAARLVTLLTAAEAAAALMGSPLLGILRGRERFDTLAVATSLQAVLGIGLVLLALDSYGLPGAAAGLLIARVVVQVGLFSWMRVRHLLDRPDGDGDAEPDLRRVVVFAVPLWVSAVGAWLGQMADVPLVGALFGEEAAGHCALGSRFAAACSGLLFAVLGAAFPRFVTARPGKRRECVGAVLFLGCTLGAAGFGLVITCATPILALWVGTAPPLAVQVLTLYALVWIVNVPTHVLASLTVAASQHRVLYVTTAIAVPVNVGLSLLLAFGGLPQGPAIASLCAILLSNWVLFPLLALRRVELTWADWLRPSLTGYGAGAAIAGLVALVLHGTEPGPVAALALGVAITLTSCAAVLDLTVRKRSALRLLWVRARRGGFPVLRRQRKQCLAVRRRLRDADSTIWTPREPPLVTVRIATYNRGRLVAERALASAIAQTHENIEIVVVGDCCDEATAEAVRSVDDPRIRFVNLAERGRYPEDPELRWMVAGSVPMSHGVELARGDWIAPLDDDDCFTPDHVEVLLNHCLERRLDFAWGVADLEMADGSWTRQGAWPLRRGQICHSAVFYSTRLAEIRHDVESWRLDDPGDWNLWSRFRAAGAAMGFVDRVVARHYMERRGVTDRRPLWLAPAAMAGSTSS